ncbi:hypothetical protein QE419_002625 [Brevundimonas vesicularis]|uniref:hypothetical protein n=1 Tax=Brevundimonas vesicularis TaxID=41276 RepID=UPI0018ED1182|nr:hypothetical protein [Brevundimonas vesicularis]MDQ1193859.1 hypothetical protein [Brevundimonas vesicularis]
MTLKTYAVKLGAPSGVERTVTVPSPTDVQAADAARPLMRENEVILSVSQLDDEAASDAPTLDAAPPKSQAAEFAPVTPGHAAATQPTPSTERGHG